MSAGATEPRPRREVNRPLYRALAEDIRRQIEIRQLRPGDRLAPERELARTRGLSRATVRQALGDLEQEGLVARRQGSGAYVAQPKLVGDFLRFDSFLDDMRSQGVEASVRIISVGPEPASEAVAAALGIATGASVMGAVTLRLANQEPVVLNRSSMPVDLGELIGRDAGAAAPLDTLSAIHGVAPARQRKWVEPILVSSRDARYLEVPPASPCLLVERLTWDGHGRAIEFRRTIVRGDRCRYMVEITQP
ncbi:MAG: GntR family transcriptional regulator [Chloroflexota bacterium]